MLKRSLVNGTLKCGRLAAMYTLIACLALPIGAATAETVTTTTIVEPKVLPNVKRIDFMALDADGSSVLSMREVGDVLFKAFDGDSNGAIDNIEYDQKSVMTVIPMEKTTLTLVDDDSDGKAEHTTLTQEEFLQRSGLMRFDKKMDGLSPRDFMGSEVKAMDLNHNNLIELDEWQREYAIKVKPKAAEQKRYNY